MAVPYLRHYQILRKVFVLLLTMMRLVLALTLVPIPDLILVHYLFCDPLLLLQGPQFPAHSQNSGYPVPFYCLQDLESELYCVLFVFRYFYLYLDVRFICLYHLQLVLYIHNLMVLFHLALQKLTYMDLIYLSLRSD